MNESITLTCAHADTCLPDYWSGHQMPHVQIPVWHGMSFGEVLDALHTELRLDAIAGDTTYCDEAWHAAAHAAIDAMQLADGTQDRARPMFEDLDPDTADADTDCHVYAFFVFLPHHD